MLSDRGSSVKGFLMISSELNWLNKIKKSLIFYFDPHLGY